MDSSQKQQKLDEIAAKIASCEVCENLCKNCTNPVPGEGNPNALVLFIGEAPGAEEDREGRPFVGSSGKFLTEMIELIGLAREDVFITNIVKYRPPNNRDPFANEIQECLPYLLAQIKIIQPKLIVFLGRHSMNIFLPELTISRDHGKPVKKGGQVYLPLYHPAAALYNNSMRETLINDFKKIPTILKKIK
ncbi:MAG: uracil-DNA glycosylase [bacterium]|nr:uracil-DNA glycosylase [bacterium]